MSIQASGNTNPIACWKFSQPTYAALWDSPYCIHKVNPLFMLQPVDSNTRPVLVQLWYMHIQETHVTLTSYSNDTIAVSSYVSH